MTLTKTNLNRAETHMPVAPTEINTIHANAIMPLQVIAHHPKSGINPIVDAAACLFSLLGKMNFTENPPQIVVLQAELIKEINLFQDNIKRYKYPKELIAVCQFVLCATIDDLLSQKKWANDEKWAHYLLKAFKQENNHEDKFFTIMERTIREPDTYIDLMELMYICLSMGYKGRFRDTANGFSELDQVTHHLYKHIQAYRGHFNKTLSPTKSKLPKQKKTRKNNFSLAFIFIITACMVMTIFVSLGYLMDVVSHEASTTIAAMGNTNT